MVLVVMGFFAGLSGLSVFRPGLCFTLILLMHPLEQVMQAHWAWLRTAGLGSQFVNYAVALTGAACVINCRLRGRIDFRHWGSRTMLATLALYLWSIVTLLWSPGGESGLEIVVSQLPYFALFILIAPALVGQIDDLNEAMRSILWVAGILCLIIVISPEFTAQLGRIAVDLGGGIRSNSLAIGELGGTLLITATTMRRGFLGSWGIAIRILAVVLGLLVAIKSGARGQFFVSVAVSIAFVPLAAPTRSLAGFTLTILSILILGSLVVTLAQSQLEGFAAKRFSLDQLLFGASSLGTRQANITALMNAWASSPTTVVFGLGYNAFVTLSEGFGDPYSHVLFADALCELGLPGALLMGLILGTGLSSAAHNIRSNINTPELRATCACAAALIAFQVFLVNKQGSLWGMAPLFPLLCIATRLRRRIDDQRFNPLDETSPRGATGESLDHYSESL